MNMAKSVSERIFLVILICLLILIGCRQKNDQQASEDTAEMATSLSKIRSDLTKARRQITDLKEELQAVKDIRDELDKQMAQMTAERDNALKTAKTAEQKTQDLNAQLSERPDSLSSLENELKERNKLIESQQTTIAEQQAIISEQEATIAALEKILQEQIPAEEQPQEEIPEPNVEG
jgi:chromosome segregation ATPase